MQIHEITIQENLGSELLKGIGRAARDQLIQKATGVGDPYQKTDMTDYVDPNAVKTSAASKPAKPSSLSPVGFNASNVLNLPGIKQPATSSPQSPEQIRQAKQAVAAQVARDQLAGKTTTQPTVTPAATSEKPGFLKTASDKIADKAKNQPATVAPIATPTAAAPLVNPAAKPEVYTLDGQPLNPSNPIHAKLIAQMQAAGVTKSRSPDQKTKK